MLRGSVLITGGTGTLGSAIVRAARLEGWPCSITIYSRSEHRQAQMRERHPQLRFVLGDIRDADRVAAAVAGHDIVIHAAAMKRIPECQDQPAECIAANVDGSRNVIRACILGGVQVCIGVSTDKACRASTLYGASKLAMEGLFRGAAELGGARFTLCRYGNVLASNGSVLPIWQRQASEGKPLTITDQRCTRFFMSERDAVKTVLRAARLEHGECFVPRMRSLNIADMARMLHPGCELVETGLRSLEKIHEDLVSPDESSYEISGGYVLSSRGQPGTCYNSDMAERLTADELGRMIGDI